MKLRQIYSKKLNTIVILTNFLADVMQCSNRGYQVLHNKLAEG